MPYVSPAAVVTGTTISKTTFGDVVKADLDYLATPPACRVFNSANLTINNASTTALTFDSERYDTDSMHSTSTNTNRITINTAGVYLVTGHARFDGDATGIRVVEILLNGATVIARQVSDPDSADLFDMAIATQYKFAATNYVELRVYQNRGAALAVLAAGNFSPEFAATWVGLG